MHPENHHKKAKAAEARQWQQQRHAVGKLDRVVCDMDGAKYAGTLEENVLQVQIKAVKHGGGSIMA